MANKKIIVILGPTASGKTRLAVDLAVKFNGEIVSADSRQVYKGMDIGTGKDLQDYRLKYPISLASPDLAKPDNIQYPIKFQTTNSKTQNEIQIPYHLIDVANPRQRFDLAKYQKSAFKAIDDILKRGKLPILTGGSGLYLQAVVDNYKLSNIKTDLNLRKKLEKLSALKLFAELKKISPKLAAKLNQSDRNNKRRLIRYLEILKQDKDFKSQTNKKKYNALIIGVKISREILKQRIFKRLLARLKEQNMIGEVETLRGQGLSWKKLEDFGLEYKFIAMYLQKKLSYEDMVQKLNIAINQFSKRQLTWFKRWEKMGAKINWENKEDKIRKLIERFLR